MNEWMFFKFQWIPTFINMSLIGDVTLPMVFFDLSLLLLKLESNNTQSTFKCIKWCFNSLLKLENSLASYNYAPTGIPWKYDHFLIYPMLIHTVSITLCYGNLSNLEAATEHGLYTIDSTS